MISFTRTAVPWTAKAGVVLAVAAATLVATTEVASAAPATATASPSTGAAGAYITVTAPANTFKTVAGTTRLPLTAGAPSANSVQFSYAACPTAAGAIPTPPAAKNFSDAVTVLNSATLTSATAAFVAGDVGRVITGTGIPTGTVISSVTNATTVVLSNPATAAGTGVSVTTAGPVFNATSVTVVSGTKLVVKAPTGLGSSGTGLTYNICVYDNAGGAATQALSTAPYKVYAAPTFTAISPVSGPSLGGGSVTISGTNLTATSKVTIGGVALVSPTISTANQTITGTLPAHAPGAVDVVITTEGGPVTAATAYNYRDGLNVTPNTMAGNASVVLDIFGAGFSAPLDFTTTDGTAQSNNKSHVFLVQGNFDPSATAGDPTSAEAECENVIVLSDTELICTLNGASANNAGLVSGALPDGAYSIVMVNNALSTFVAGATGATYRETIITSGSSFTVAPY